MIFRIFDNRYIVNAVIGIVAHAAHSVGITDKFAVFICEQSTFKKRFNNIVCIYGRQKIIHGLEVGELFHSGLERSQHITQNFIIGFSRNKSADIKSQVCHYIPFNKIFYGLFNIIGNFHAVKIRIVVDIAVLVRISFRIKNALKNIC